MPSSETIAIDVNDLQRLLRDRQELRDNLTITQIRCSELLEDSRGLRRENARLRKLLLTEETSWPDGTMHSSDTPAVHAEVEVPTEIDVPALNDPHESANMIVFDGSPQHLEPSTFSELGAFVFNEPQTSITGSILGPTQLWAEEVNVTSGSLVQPPKSAFTSPHRQPPFKPTMPGGRSWFNRRVD